MERLFMPSRFIPYRWQALLVQLVTIFFFLLVLQHQVNAANLLLTGKVSSSAKQLVSAPHANRWQIQIQWMEEEGAVVQKGDPVVVFDGASEQNALLNNEENLERLNLELQQLRIEHDQKVLDADGRFKVARMRVEKAKIEAFIPSSEVSDYDKGQFELVLQRALLEEVKAQEALTRAKQERQAELTKKEVDILKTKEEITYLHNILAKLRVEALHTGPVTYATHPWYGTKVDAGMNVRPSWKVLDVQSTEGFQVETWIHEVDAIGVVENAAVDIVFDAYPKQQFRGILRSLSKQSEAKPQWSDSAYFAAIVDFLELPNIHMMPGMSVRLFVAKE